MGGFDGDMLFAEHTEVYHLTE